MNIIDNIKKMIATKRNTDKFFDEFTRAKNWSSEKIYEILKRGINVNAVDNNGRTPLYYAILYTDVDIVTELIKMGADPNIVYERKRSLPLFTAVQNGYFDKALKLVESGAKADDDYFGQFIIFGLAAHGLWDLAIKLFENGSGIHITNENGETISHVAAKANQWNIVRQLVDMDTDINFKDKTGNTILNYLAESGPLDIVCKLIVKGADTNPKEIEHSSLSRIIDNKELFSKSSDMHIADKKLLEKKILEIIDKIYVKDKNGDTMLHAAIRNGHVNTTKFIINQHKALINEPDYYGNTPWQIAMEKNDFVVAKLLEEKDAKKSISENSEIKEQELKLEIDKGNIFVRPIKEPHMPNTFSKTSIRKKETNAGREFRKISRHVGYPTPKKDSTDTEGSPVRSTSMYVNGSKLFASIGYGITNPDLADISVIASHDTVMNQNEEKIKQLKNLFESLKDTKNQDSCNEVVMDIKDNGKIKFVFYNLLDGSSNEKNYSTDSKKLLSIYVQKQYEKTFGAKLHIFEFSEKAYPKEYKYDLFEFERIIKSLSSYDPDELMTNPDMIELIKDIETDFKNHDLSKMKLDTEHGNTYVRCICEPTSKTEKGETSWELELRKIKRHIGQPTRTKVVGTKEGNPNRSTSMYYFDSPTFGEVGYGIERPELGDIKVVSSVNYGSGNGKKSHVRIIDVDPFIKHREETQKKLKLLFNGIKYHKKAYHNEVVMDVKDNDKIKFIFFNQLKDRNKLDCIYMQKIYEKEFGKKLPILDLSKREPKEYTYNKFEIDRLRISEPSYVEGNKDLKDVLGGLIRKKSNELVI